MNKDWSGVIDSILRLVVGVIGLIALRLIAEALPMMRDLPSVIPTIISAIIMTALIGVILWFGRDMKSKLPFLLPRFSDSGNMAFALVGLAAIVVGYFAYYDLILPLSNLTWLYSSVFLLLALVDLVALIILAYRNIDKLTQLGKQGPSWTPMSQSSGGPTPTSGAITEKQGNLAQNRCPNCGWIASSGDVFCGSCGQRLMSSDNP